MSSRVSVVVASGAGGEFLFNCLASLRAQVTSSDVEVIVVDRVGPAIRERVARECPTASVIAAPSEPRPTIPRMRRIGVEAATADIVAILEEHCTVPPGWIDAIASNMQTDDAAIGGPILDGDFRSLRDWCVYFSEYHNYLPPWTDGDRFSLNGANVAYDRHRLLRYASRLGDGYWEVVLHPLLVKDGRFRAVNALGAFHNGPFGYGYYLRQRYLLSRAWGGAQKGIVPLSKRLAHIALGPVFPVLLFVRVTMRVREKPRYLGRYILSLPLLVPAWICYSFGEWLGYVAGPGRALEEVE